MLVSRINMACWLLIVVVGTLLLLAGCDRFFNHGVRTFVEEPFPQKLSQWHLFVSPTAELTPNQGVLPYDLNTPLFSDYANKHRFVWMPAGKAAQYKEDGVFEFPVGTILAKTFAFPAETQITGGKPRERMIETRLLVRAKSGWVALPYIWGADQREATLQLVPDPVPVKWTDAAGKTREFNYVIPNANECGQCHENNKVLLPIGPKARNLNKDYSYADGIANQLTRWQQAGYLQGVPATATILRAARWDDTRTGSLDQRARAYLDNNCAHCHQPGSAAGYTGVDFRLTQTELAHQGLCKAPNSAGYVGGLSADLVPGKPDESIMIFRLESVAPKISMPALGRDVVHEEGVKLLRDWIASLNGGCGKAGQPKAQGSGLVVF